MSNKVADWGISLQGSKHLPLWWNQRGEKGFPSRLRPLWEGKALHLTLLLFCCSSSVFPAPSEPGWWKECPLGKVSVRALLLRPRQVLWRNPRLVPGRRQDFWLEI